MEENTKEVTNTDILNALTELNQNTVATNNSVKDLQAYFIKKDRQQEEDLQKQEEQEAEQKEIEAQENEKAAAEQSAKADSETETYTELLTDINDGITLNNHLIAGQIFFMGALLGVLLIKILFDRFR